jgi:hypothetical protein
MLAFVLTMLQCPQLSLPRNTDFLFLIFKKIFTLSVCKVQVINFQKLSAFLLVRRRTIINMFRTKALYLMLLLFAALQTSLPVFGQATFPIKEWAKKLNSKDDVENSYLRKISWFTLRNYDSATVADCIK